MIDELFASLGLDVARLEPETIALLRRKYTAWVTYRKNAARPILVSEFIEKNEPISPLLRTNF
jgi:hypothetical protein